VEKSFLPKFDDRSFLVLSKLMSATKEKILLLLSAGLSLGLTYSPYQHKRTLMQRRGNGGRLMKGNCGGKLTFSIAQN